jgi:hypothetical protein
MRRKPSCPTVEAAKVRFEELLPKDRIPWAREIWADREEVAKADNGPWTLREAAKALGMPEEAADELLRRQSDMNRFRY